MPRRRSGGEALNAWPGYVDALSTLLMVIIFVLLVFVLAQAFLSVTLSGRDQQLERLGHQLSELSDLLQLERSRSAELGQQARDAGQAAQQAAQAHDDLARQLAALHAESARIMDERDTLRGDRDRLAARLSDADLEAQSAQARTAQLQAQVGRQTQAADAAGQDAAGTAAQLAQAQRDLAAARALLADMQQAAAQADRTVQADRATIAARLSDLAHMAEQVRALSALREQLERQAQDAAVAATTERQRREAVAVELAQQKSLGDSAQAQLAMMSRDVDDLKRELARVKDALALSETSGQDKDVQIANLGQRLNAALAQKVEELQRYRSDFFGRLREVLANRPGIQVVGDRFVFQSEVLFPAGSADLSAGGRDQISTLAATLKQIAVDIPPDVNWLLRVDGHADRQPVDPTGLFIDNWDLSAKRAIQVVQLLIQAGIPANRLAATAFGDNQPLDDSATQDAYRKNRRIEIRLTDR